MKKTFLALIITTLALLFANAGFAQTYMPEKVGTKITYVDKDAKDKIIQAFRYEITDVQKDDGKTTILFDVVWMNDKFKETGEVYKGKVWSADGYFHTDVRYALGSMASLVNIDSIKGHTIILPEHPQNGEKLDDCRITGPGISITNTDIVVTTGQSVTTNAGTFDCIRVDSEDGAQITVIKVNASSKQWWKLGVGAIKYESYNKKGKMTLNRELYSIE
ncbi:MAG: hypothetical protein J6T63_06950 [Bacteroidales bacterium]|nr:hypothetical protein [Bacteroidales bacterium]